MKLDNPLNVRNIHKKDPHVIKKMKEKQFTYIVLRLFASFCELSGDRISSDDHAFISGVESFHGCPVTVIGHQKGKGSVEEALYRNWGMPSPQGYRKVMRLAKQVEKFHKPVIFFCRHNWYRLRKRSRRGGTGNSNCQCSTGNEYTENYNFINCLGEGGSGGALVLGLGNQVWMLENAVYSIFTPESYASIIWRDNTRTVETASLINFTGT